MKKIDQHAIADLAGYFVAVNDELQKFYAGRHADRLCANMPATIIIHWSDGKDPAECARIMKERREAEAT